MNAHAKKVQKLIDGSQKLIGLLVEEGMELRANEWDGNLMLGIEKREGLLSFMLDKNKEELYEMHAMYFDDKSERHFLIGESINQNAETTFAKMKNINEGLDQAKNQIEHVREQAQKTCSVYQK
ncbi:hypothetical protein SOP94_19660 [Peribacillus frigoritolerans]|uniref:hypothetical protein n=1 Tax=Peribacillus frigoritolerans TaxID=450367 RepID=UPI002B24621C|nr:hypothetical protein [Peribacillus frigoritolerans]MEB2630676.1 hypothetical protein [Peribacillus frigoritolerans]